MENYIELNRTFHQLSANYSNEAKSDDVNITDALGNYFGSNLSWEELLNEPRSILLAEAGAGKTQEIRYATKKLRFEGKAAFFLRLEHIVDDLEISFEVGTYNEFQSWLRSSKEGWLLLDSVDEARLKDPKDFERAIRKLSSQISPALQRAHIIVTSRITAWRPMTDLRLCNTRLPFNESCKIDEVESFEGAKGTRIEEELLQALDSSDAKYATQSPAKENSGFKIYSLNDLTKEQVKVFVKAKRVSDDARLLEEIDRQDAWAFTTRPQDLDELLGFWEEKNEIGTRFELMQHSIDRRIKEWEQDRAVINPLTFERARKGVQLLATACTLINESVIRIPDSENKSGDSGGIDVTSILYDWDERECHILLSRPIFDEAIYGAVRFHHRSVREYLTAEWLSERLNEAGSRKKIEDLFFRNQYGLEVIVPSMKPVLSWLVLLDSKIMQKVYRLEPEIILEGGDPSRLPLENRKEILRSICKKITSQSYNRSIDESSSVQRFASPDLVEEVKRLLQTHKNDPQVIHYLLRLVWQGHMQQALPEAMSLAFNSKLETYVRIAAVQAVRLLGSKKDFEEILKAYLLEEEPHHKSLLAELIPNLESTKEAIHWILKALNNIQVSKKYESTNLNYSLLDFISSTNESILFQFVKGIGKFLCLEPVIAHRDCEISKKYGWLLPISLKAVEKLVLNKHSDALQPESLFVLSQMPCFGNFGEFENISITHDLPNLVPAWQELNHQLFWHTVEDKRKRLNEEKGEFLRSYWHVTMYGSYWKFSESDFAIIIQDMSIRSLPDDRLVALSLACRLFSEYSSPEEWLFKLNDAVSGEAILEQKLSEFLCPPPSEDMENYRRQEAKWKHRNEKREKKEKENHEEWAAWLLINYQKLRDNGLGKGQVSSAQHYLFYHRSGVNKGIISSKLSGEKWEDLISIYGVIVAKAYRDGLIKHWRNYIPTLLSEKDIGNNIPLGLLFGLTGLEIETSDGLEDFSEHDAEIACLYAINSLNNFPNWFYQLYTKFPNIVEDLLCREIRWELEESEMRIHVLNKVWSAEWLWDSLAPKILEYLEGKTLNITTLNSALYIVHGSLAITDQQLASLAAEKCKTVKTTKNLASWFTVWIGVEPEKAIMEMTPYLTNLYKHDIDAAKHLAMEVIVNLAGRRYNLPSVRNNFKSPRHLKDLYLLMHNYIKVEEDIERADTGAYSPGLRDYAQEARSSLFSMLKETRGKESYLAMLDLSKTHPVESHRQWMLRNAKERAELDSENLCWNWAKVKEFTRTLESTPVNHQELFDLGVQRLLDFKYQLEEGDDSIAPTLIKEKQETGIRRFIANWCRDRAFGRYTITQEEELADAKRPDCRFLSSLFDAPVPMELKLVDNNWSGSKLFERLENQLCGDYLRDSHSNRGIFLLVYRGEKSRWDIPNGRRVTFTELVEELQNHWETLSPQFPKIEQITVIGIDLTKRTEK